MKKVTAFIGTERRKWTWQAVRELEKNLCQYGDVNFETVFLNDYNLEFCRGCILCFNKGEDHCPLKDDRDALLEKLEGSDGVIFATPSYAFQVSARMKNLLDRTAFIFHRPRFFGKPSRRSSRRACPWGAAPSVSTWRIAGRIWVSMWSRASACGRWSRCLKTGKKSWSGTWRTWRSGFTSSLFVRRLLFHRCSDLCCSGFRGRASSKPRRNSLTTAISGSMAGSSPITTTKRPWGRPRSSRDVCLTSSDDGFLAERKKKRLADGQRCVRRVETRRSCVTSKTRDCLLIRKRSPAITTGDRWC